MFPFNFAGEGNPGSRLFTLVIVLMTILNFCMAVFWIIVGWRAMKAHERLPEALSASLRNLSAKHPTVPGDPAGP